MVISTARKSLGIGVAGLALLGGAASGIATAGTAHAAGTTGVHAGTAAVAASHTCTWNSSLGFHCGYYNGHGTVGYGNQGNAVKEVQALISQTTGYKPKLAVDGKFGSKTKKAVLWFQKKYHVKPYDGIVGKKTWKELRLK